MTEQLKAEAYVREQRPALMEGRHDVMYYTRFLRGVLFQIVQYYDADALANPPISEKVRQEITKVWRKDNEIYTSPNLQDWLGVLEKLDTNYHLSFEGQIMEYNPEDGTLHLTGIWFDMGTGQPATEGDFKAFNDIVNI